MKFILQPWQLFDQRTLRQIRDRFFQGPAGVIEGVVMRPL